MTAVNLELDESTLDRLRRRAERDGVSPEQFAKDAVLRQLAQDPYEFVAAGASSQLRGRDADQHLADGFGRD